jgi:hypothetical protein
MYLVRIGYRTVNLEFLIETIDSELGAPAGVVSPDKILVSVYPGDKFEVGGDDAAHLRLHIEDNLKPLPAPKDADGTHPGPKPKPRPRRGGEPISPSPTRSNPVHEKN